MASAVGRALANLGFKIDNGIASREEMQKVERMSSNPTKSNGANGSHKQHGRVVSQSVP